MNHYRSGKHVTINESPSPTRNYRGGKFNTMKPDNRRAAGDYRPN